MEKIDGVYHSSGWDETYFKPEHLSDDKTIYIYYDEGIKNDTLRIKDYGVGLGKDRMTGYFKLA